MQTMLRVFVLTVMFLGATLAHGEFITNGDFENGTTGWEIQGGNWSLATWEFVSPSHSIKALGTWSELAQEIDGVPSSLMTLSYNLKDVNSFWPEVLVSIRQADQPSTNPLFQWYERPAAGWMNFTHDFTLPVGVDDIIVSFQWTRWGDQVYLDNVSMVPEPTTIGLLTLGGLILRRRK